MKIQLEPVSKLRPCSSLLMSTFITDYKDTEKALFTYPSPHPVGSQEASACSKWPLEHTREPKEATRTQKEVKPVGLSLLHIQALEGLPLPLGIPPGLGQLSSQPFSHPKEPKASHQKQLAYER